ncbi:MAG: hypothetical protein ACI9CD_000811 [Candidatus Deianiraeaceae bacterium]|jgi:hypothetical protein
MDKILEFLEKTHRKNWWLFIMCLSVTHTWVFHHLNGSFWNYSIGKNHPFFLFLEIILLATGVARLLVAVKFIDLLERTPIISDIVNYFWWERRMRIQYTRHHVMFEHNEELKEDFFTIIYQYYTLTYTSVDGVMISRTKPSATLLEQKQILLHLSLSSNLHLFERSYVQSYIEKGTKELLYEHIKKIDNANFRFFSQCFNIFTNESGEVLPYIVRQCERKIFGFFFERKPIGKKLTLGHVYVVVLSVLFL